MPRKFPISIDEEEFKLLIKNTKRMDHKIGFLLGFGAGLRLSELVGSTKHKSRCCQANIIEEKVKKDNKYIKLKHCGKCNVVLTICKDTYLSNEVDIKPLKKENIDFENRRILIENAKGEKDRIVPIPKGFKESMLQYLPLNKKYKNIQSARRSFERAFNESAKKAKLLEIKPKLHFHSLRHGFGSRMANQGVPIHHIRTLMGHSNISTTNIYMEANPKLALKSYEDLF